MDKQLNQGGNGTVFQVHDGEKQLYALKAIERSKTTSDKLKRFRNEVAFCQNKNHPNIIRVIDHGSYQADNDNIIFCIMPLYPKTLRTLIKNGIELAAILTMFEQILSALSYAHDKSIWHRDIKPENILIDTDGKPIIADFGIAHFSEVDLATAIETRNSDRLANFQYAAPEQRMRGAAVDGRADIYAAGLILNEMFTKQIIAGANYLRISSVSGEYAYLDQIVDEMISQQPSERLWPASKVSTRIIAAQTDKVGTERLTAIATQSGQQEDAPFVMKAPSVVDFNYRNGLLYIYISKVDYYYSQIWFEALRSGRYGHTAPMGFEPHRLKFEGTDCITMQIPADNSGAIKGVVENIKEWIDAATANFNAEQKAAADKKEREKRQKLEAEIARIRREQQARAQLASLLGKLPK